MQATTARTQRSIDGKYIDGKRWYFKIAYLDANLSCKPEASAGEIKTFTSHRWKGRLEYLQRNAKFSTSVVVE